VPQSDCLEAESPAFDQYSRERGRCTAFIVDLEGSRNGCKRRERRERLGGTVCRPSGAVYTRPALCIELGPSHLSFEIINGFLNDQAPAARIPEKDLPSFAHDQVVLPCGKTP
jgi:hypothetical protein